MVRWVFFDVDQTLCDFATMMRSALESALGELQRRLPTPTSGLRSTRWRLVTGWAWSATATAIRTPWGCSQVGAAVADS